MNEEEKASGTFTCGRCGAEFDSREDLRTHVYDEHIDPDRPDELGQTERGEGDKRIVVVWENLSGATATRTEMSLVSKIVDLGHTHEYQGNLWPCYPERWKLKWSNPSNPADLGYGQGDMHRIDI